MMTYAIQRFFFSDGKVRFKMVIMYAFHFVVMGAPMVMKEKWNI